MKKYFAVMTKGFSLIELLIVVLIMGILAGILVPSFGALATKAKLKEIYTVTSLIIAGEKYYFTRTGSFYGLGDYADAENALKIALPRVPDAFCVYDVGTGTMLIGECVVKVFAGGQILYEKSIRTGASRRNLTHPYAKYIRADN